MKHYGLSHPTTTDQRMNEVRQVTDFLNFELTVLYRGLDLMEKRHRNAGRARDLVRDGN